MRVGPCLPLIATVVWLTPQAAPAQSDTTVTVLFDVAHHNIGSPTRFASVLGSWLAEFGFTVEQLHEPFSREVLKAVDVVVIRGPLNAVQAEDWGSSVRPTPPAFESSEVCVLRDWVGGGGALLVVAEHMPMSGAVRTLLEVFDVEVLDGFVVGEDRLSAAGMLEDSDRDGWLQFSRPARLADHPVTAGRSDDEKVDHITTDVGAAFRLPGSATSLLTLGPSSISLMPDTAWAFGPHTLRENVDGWSQGAVLCTERGRLAVLADAWPFMPGRFFETPEEETAAVHHPQFTLNLMNWLAGRLPCAQTDSAGGDSPIGSR